MFIFAFWLEINNIFKLYKILFVNSIFPLLAEYLNFLAVLL
jgi:hypothetical protein